MHHDILSHENTGVLLRPEVEQMANELGVQTLVSPAMCGDIGDLLQWVAMDGAVGQRGWPVFFVCLFKDFVEFHQKWWMTRKD